MGNVLKNIVIAILLAVLAFIAGSLSVDGFKQAIYPAFFVLGVFLLIYLGDRCWWLIFLLPPVMGVVDTSFLKEFPLPFLLSGVVMVYWIILCIMGYTRVTWKTVIWMDLFSAFYIAYFFLTYIWHPVTLNILTDFTDGGDILMGGKEYVFCLGALICYSALSIVPCSLEQMRKVAKYAFILTLVVAVIWGAIYILKTGSAVASSIRDGRNGAFAGIGDLIIRYLFAKWSVLGVILSPWKLLLLLVAALSVAISGFREYFLSLGVYTMITSFLQRRIASLFILVFSCYGVFLFLSSSKALYGLPFGVQRILSSVPGMEVNKDIAADAEHSLEWRQEMWEWALDPTQGYIKDYVWGDGFALSTKKLRLTTIAMNRGQANDTSQNNRFFAETGVWHSGYITAIHRIGYIGLIWTFIWSALLVFLIMRVCLALRKMKGNEFIYCLIIPGISSVVHFFVSAGTFPRFFYMFYYAGVAKSLYCEALKEGLMQPLFVRRVYVPLLFKEDVSEAQESRAPRLS